VRLRQAGILLMIIAILSVLFVPVWQSAVNRSLSVELESELNQLQTLEERYRALQSSIASRSMPESLVDEAWERQVSFSQIEADDIVLVERSS
jgi:Tfp pilus assembly protein PilE